METGFAGSVEMEPIFLDLQGRHQERGYSLRPALMPAKDLHPCDLRVSDCVAQQVDCSLGPRSSP